MQSYLPFCYCCQLKLHGNVLFVNRCCRVTLIRVVQSLRTSSLKTMKMRVKVRVRVAQNNRSCPCYSMTSCNNPVCCQLSLHTFEMILVRLQYKAESQDTGPSSTFAVYGWALIFMWYRNNFFLTGSACVCVCVCERERERVRARTHGCMCVCVCVRALAICELIV
jgi:hypothetical protein